MKRLFLSLFLLIVFQFIGIEDKQIIKKCATDENLALQESKDSSLRMKLERAESSLTSQVTFIKNMLRISRVEDEIITIPVVVHILYENDAQNVTDQRVIEQIEILNRDYAGRNPHSMGVFLNHLKNDTKIRFCLAKKKADGSMTNAIERRRTSVRFFSYEKNDAKYYRLGGLDAWDPQKYLNVWVCNLEKYAGYAVFPTTYIDENFGVVIKYQYFGATGAASPLDGGGTTTHEIGHCFNLYHIWGDANSDSCDDSDRCDDTPNQFEASSGTSTPSLKTDQCSPTSPGIMYMNFMDYSDDSDYANFTPDQTLRMRLCFIKGGPLFDLANSDVCK